MKDTRSSLAAIIAIMHLFSIVRKSILTILNGYRGVERAAGKRYVWPNRHRHFWTHNIALVDHDASIRLPTATTFLQK